MPEPRLYRDKIYAEYATVQVPSWLQHSQKVDPRGQRAIIRRLRAWLPEERSISCLDLGCGAGELLLALRSMGYADARGVDSGSQQVAIATSRGVNAVRADVLDYLQTSAARFDVISAFDVLEHFTKDEVLNLLPLIRTHLKPGGRLLLQTPNAMSPWVSHIRYGDLTHETIFSPQCLASTLRFTGFRDIAVREISPSIYSFGSAIRWALWKFIWAGCFIWSCVECGNSCGGVYTRNMLVNALRDDTVR